MSAGREGHTRKYPCPVCGGHDGQRRGQGERCHGYSTERSIYCSREEHAGRAEFNATRGLYWHRRFGECPCGLEHGRDYAPLASSPRPAPKTSAPDPAALYGRAKPLDGTPGAAYLSRRGLSPELATAAGVRYAPDFAGAAAVVYPLRNPATGELVAVEGRYIDPGHTPKTRAYGSKGDSGFLTPGALDSDQLVLAEGPADALALAAAGVPAIATMGAHVPLWLTALQEQRGRSLVIAFDADQAGDEAAAATLKSLNPGVAVARWRPPEGMDWADVLERIGLEGLKALLVAMPGPKAAPVAATPQPAGAPTISADPTERDTYISPHAQFLLEQDKARIAELEQKDREQRRLIDGIFDVVTDVSYGEEVRLLVGVEIAHFRGDPELQRIAGNRWRLPQQLARQLCGKKNLKTAGDYAIRLAQRGSMSVAPEELKKFTRTDGVKVEAHVLTYFYPPGPVTAPLESASEAEPLQSLETPEAVAEANRPILLSRARRLQAKREARGSIRNFSGCPDHPHARVKMRRHCAVCDRCLEPRGVDVFDTAPAPSPFRQPLQTLETKTLRSSLQTLETPASCTYCGEPANWRAPNGKPYCPAHADPPVLTPRELAAAQAEWLGEYAAAGGG